MEDLKLMVSLLVAAKKYWKYLFLSMAAIVCLTASQLYAPLVVRELTNMAVSGDPALATQSFSMALILLAAYLVQAVCTYIRSYYTHFAAWHFVADMRTKVYDKLQQLSLKYYHDKQTGQLMSRVVNDTGNLETLIAHAAPDLVVNILILIGVAVILFVINPVLAAISLITIPFLLFSARIYSKKVLPLFRSAQQLMGQLNADLQDNLSGIKEIQVFNQQRYEKEKVKGSAKAHANAILSALKYSASYHCTVQFLSNMGSVFVIAYGGYLASQGKIPVADIVAFIMYLSIFYQPVTTLARLAEDINTSIAGAERVFEVLDSEPDVKEKPHPHELNRVKGAIRFEGVNFHYIEGQEVLRDINVDIKPGEIVALVGPTGVGKTTFISLLNRFYDPVAGRITVDGMDIRDVSLRSLRDNISNVLQDIFLFNGSVADNIAYGSGQATREQIIEAAKIAKAHDFICNFEEGYDTMIGERGIKLSGGQKQRLSIARAVLRNKPVLILDEATASVDVETEKLIHEAMDQVMENRTTIIIAHRLSTIKKADKIVVLNEGRVEDIGRHDELVAAGGLYAYLSEINYGTSV